MNQDEQLAMRYAEQALVAYANKGFIPCYQVTEALDRIRALKSDESKDAAS
jgi:hypothetical protein